MKTLFYQYRVKCATIFRHFSALAMAKAKVVLVISGIFGGLTWALVSISKALGLDIPLEVLAILAELLTCYFVKQTGVLTSEM